MTGDQTSRVRFARLDANGRPRDPSAMLPTHVLLPGGTVADMAVAVTVHEAPAAPPLQHTATVDPRTGRRLLVSHRGSNVVGVTTLGDGGMRA